MKMNLLRSIIRQFDRWLSRIHHVHEFTSDDEVFMRIQHDRAACDLDLADGTVPSGSEVIMLHMWNERSPLLSPLGPDLAWALNTRRLLITSLKGVARYIQQEAALQDIKAVGGITAHILLQGASGGRNMLERLGFQVFPYHRPAGAFGEFWENFYTYWLMWAYNPHSLRHHKLLSLQRAEFWMSKHKFLNRYGDKSA